MPPALRWSLVGAGSLLIATTLVCLIVAANVGDPKVPMAGNRQPCIDQAIEGRGPYTFAVIGDSPNAVASFDRIMQKVMAERPAFIIHTGNLVRENDDGHYRLAFRGLSKAALQIPMFVVPGRHETKGGTGVFEKTLGPATFAFGRAPVSLIALPDNDGSTPDPIALEAALRPLEGRKICLFTHTPPFDPLQPQFTPRPGWEQFLQLCRQYQVAYVFSGRSPRYARHQFDLTAFIAEGEADAPDHKMTVTIVEATKDYVREHPLSIETTTDWTESVVHFSVGHVAQAFRSLPLLWWPATAALAALVGWLAFKRTPRPSPPTEPPKPA